MIRIKKITVTALVAALVVAAVPTRVQAFPWVVGSIFAAGLGSYYVAQKMGAAFTKRIEGFANTVAETTERLIKIGVATGGAIGAWHISKWWHGGYKAVPVYKPALVAGDSWAQYKWPITGIAAGAAAVVALKRYAQHRKSQKTFVIRKGKPRSSQPRRR